MEDVILKVERLKKHFPLTAGLTSILLSRHVKYVHAVDDVSFTVRRGEIFSLVGETGSGKTTIGRLVLRLLDPDEGKILFDDQDVLSFDKKKMKTFRRSVNIIFQDPFSSLNPRKTVEDIVSLPLKAHGIRNEVRKRVVEALEEVGLVPPEDFLKRYPQEFSGGQRQRIGIARAIILKPKFIVADEPVTALDTSIRAQILILLRRLQKDLGLTYLLVSHDLSVVRHVSNTVAVMYAGKILELAPTEKIFTSYLHPYTEALISAVPIPEPNLEKERIRLTGEMPSLVDPPPGCRFFSRCCYRMTKCTATHPELTEVEKGHFVACYKVAS